MSRIIYKLKREFSHNGVLYLMCLPVVVGVFIFNYIPKIGIVMAFQKLDVTMGPFSSPWVGLENFQFLFASTDAWRITRNTVAYALWFLIIGMFCAVLLSLLINELTNKRMAKWLQTTYMMPYFLSIIAVAMVTFAFLGDRGLVNTLLSSFGLPAINWYAEPSKWPGILTIVHLWRHVGFSTVLYLATISGISNEYYEAAVIDGASRFQQAIYITIPFLKPMMTILLIMGMGAMMSGDFGMFYAVTRNSGALYPTTDIIDTYIFRSMLTMNNFGMSTAVGIYQSGVGFILLLITNYIVRKVQPDYAIF